MKIIAVDILAREYIADQLIAENVNAHYAPIIAQALNAKCSGPEHPLFYVAKPDDYQLQEVDY